MLENTKSLITIIIALIAAGGGFVAWKGYLQEEFSASSEEELHTPLLVGRWKPESNKNSGCQYLFIFRDNGEEMEGNCDNPEFKHNIKGRYVKNNYIELTVTRETIANECEIVAKGSYKVLDANTLEYIQEGWNGECDTTKSRSAGSSIIYRD